MMKIKMMKKRVNLYNLAISVILLSLLSLLASCTIQEKDRVSEKKSSYILYSKNNSYGLMKEGDNPFLSLGINHIQAITYPTPL